jgi:hypothetical protein
VARLALTLQKSVSKLTSSSGNSASLIQGWQAVAGGKAETAETVGTVVQGRAAFRDYLTVEVVQEMEVAAVMVERAEMVAKGVMVGMAVL